MHDEMLFSEEFVAGLPELSRFDNPIVVRLSRDTMPSNIKLRNAIESWYSKLPKEEKPSMRARLRSLNDDEHQSAFFELALQEHFEKSGLAAEKEPELADGTTPDFRIIAHGSEAFVEVRTIMEDRESQLNHKRKNDALIQIDKIHCKFVLSVHFEKEPEPQTKPTELRKEVEAWLSGLNIPQGQSEKKLFWSGGYAVEVRANNEPSYGEGTGRIMFNGGPVKALGASLGLMYRGIKKKAAKYKDLQRDGKPYVVAICSTDMNFMLEDIWITLAAYGSLQGEPNDRATFSLKEDRPKNPGLSGILHCKLLQDKENFGLQINFFRNPHAKSPMPEELGWHNTTAEAK